MFAERAIELLVDAEKCLESRTKEAVVYVRDDR